MLTPGPDGSLRLIIASTWDGDPLSSAEHTVVVLSAVDGGLGVTLEAPYVGDPPPPEPRGSLDGLWEHEVVELFIAGTDGRYLELEFGPHGHYLALRFRARRVRDGGPLPLVYRAEVDPPTVDPRGWRGRARVAAAYLPPPPHAINAYAIAGTRPRRHSAYRPVPGPHPDFHQPSAFAPALLPLRETAG